MSRQTQQGGWFSKHIFYVTPALNPPTAFQNVAGLLCDGMRSGQKPQSTRIKVTISFPAIRSFIIEYLYSLTFTYTQRTPHNRRLFYDASKWIFSIIDFRNESMGSFLFGVLVVRHLKIVAVITIIISVRFSLPSTRQFVNCVPTLPDSPSSSSLLANGSVILQRWKGGVVVLSWEVYLIRGTPRYLW